MSSFDFTDANDDTQIGGSSRGASFDFFQQHSIPGLLNSSFPAIRQPGSGGSGVYIATSSSSRDASFSFGGGAADSGKRRVESGPQSHVDLQSMRARRETQIIAARKAKRSSRFAMQRRIGVLDDSSNSCIPIGSSSEARAGSGSGGGVDSEMSITSSDAPLTNVTTPYTQIHEKILQENLVLHCALVSSDNLSDQHEGIKWFRKILSGERASFPPADKVVGCGIMPRIISFLDVGYNVEIQKEACWTISHLACADGDDIGSYLVGNGVIPLLVKLLVAAKGSTKERLRETCLSCIGNLSAYTKECRDLLLESGILEPLLAQLGMEFQIAEGASIDNGKVVVVKPTASPSLATMTFLSWSFDNLTKGEPAPPDHMTRQMMLPLSCLLQSPDEKVVLTSMNTLLTLCESSAHDQNVQLLLEYGMLRRVYEILVSLPVPAGSGGSGNNNGNVNSNGNGNGGGSGSGSGDGSPSSPGSNARRHRRLFGSADLSALTAINTKNLGLRVFAAALRSSSNDLHKRTVVCPAHFPRLLPMMVAELARTAEIKPTLGVWGSVRAKGNSFYQGGASDIYKANNHSDDGQKEVDDVRRFEVEYDIKLELVAGMNALIMLDNPQDRKYTHRLLDLDILAALHSAATYNHFNLNVIVSHCLSLLLERLDYTQVVLRPSQQHWSSYDPASPARAMAQGGVLSGTDLVIPVVRHAVVLMTQLLPSMRGDLEVLMLILHRTTHLLSWAQSLELFLLDSAEAAVVAGNIQDLSMHAHQDVSSWANILHSLLDSIATSSAPNSQA